MNENLKKLVLAKEEEKKYFREYLALEDEGAAQEKVAAAREKWLKSLETLNNWPAIHLKQGDG